MGPRASSNVSYYAGHTEEESHGHSQVSGRAYHTKLESLRAFGTENIPTAGTPLPGAHEMTLTRGRRA